MSFDFSSPFCAFIWRLRYISFNASRSFEFSCIARRASFTTSAEDAVASLKPAIWTMRFHSSLVALLSYPNVSRLKSFIAICCADCWFIPIDISFCTSLLYPAIIFEVSSLDFPCVTANDITDLKSLPSALMSALNVFSPDDIAINWSSITFC